MLKKDRYQDRIELLQGTLDLLILLTLQWGPQHGYGISQSIQANSGDVLRVDTGSLYPALHRLERQKWIDSEWTVSENITRVPQIHIDIRVLVFTLLICLVTSVVVVLAAISVLVVVVALVAAFFLLAGLLGPNWLPHYAMNKPGSRDLAREEDTELAYECLELGLELG